MGVAVPVGVGEVSVGLGEYVGEGVGDGVGEGLELFSTMKNETSKIATKKTATRIIILCCLRTCIYNNTLKFCIFIYVATEKNPKVKCGQELFFLEIRFTQNPY